MRYPLRWFAVCTAVALLCAVAVQRGAQEFDRAGETGLALALLVPGLAIGVVALIWIVISARAAIGQARLMADPDPLARWHVPAADWDRFRAAEREQSTLGPARHNDLSISGKARPQGVGVIAGTRAILVDGSFHWLSPRGNPTLRNLAWRATSPPTLEFELHYLRGSPSIGVMSPRAAYLRIPVPEASRAQGARVVEHYRALVRQAETRSRARWPRIRALLLLGLLVFTGGMIAAMMLVP